MKNVLIHQPCLIRVIKCKSKSKLSLEKQSSPSCKFQGQARVQLQAAAGGQGRNQIGKSGNVASPIDFAALIGCVVVFLVWFRDAVG